MKKVYTKPNMEIVSFTAESIAADPRSLTTTPIQARTNIRTISY